MGCTSSSQENRNLRANFNRVVKKVDCAEHTFGVDNSTRFWIFLCRVQGTTARPPSSVVKNVAPRTLLPIYPGSVEGFDTMVRFTDLDEDTGDQDGSLGGLVEGALFLHAQNLENDETDLKYFESIQHGIKVGREVLGEALPPSIVPWEDLSTDDSMSKLAFYGLGQMYLTAVRHAEAIKVEGAVFEIDLTFLFEYATRKAFEPYGCVAIFDTDKNIIAIYWCFGHKMVYAPKTGVKDQAVLDEWNHVKFVFKSSLVTAVTIKDHLVHLHWTISNTLVFSTRQSFSANHPLRRLLKPHTYRTASINWASKTVLLPDDALAWRVFAIDKADWYRAVNDCIHANKYQTFDDFCREKNLPAEVAATLPLIQDGKALTAVIRKYVSDYVSVYYKTSAEVLADTDIHTYWGHYGSLPLWPSYGLPALSKETLIDQITHTILGVTGMHELLGSLVEYLVSPAGLGCKIAPGKAEVDVQSFFQQLSLIALTGLSQPLLMNEWKHIILYDAMPAGERTQISDIVDAFQADLVTLAAQVAARNESRLKPFRAMDPSVLECSVSI